MKQPMTASSLIRELGIDDDDYEKIKKLAEFYISHACRTENVGTDSLTGFLGMVYHWINGNTY